MEKEVWTIDAEDAIPSGRSVGESESATDRRCYLRRILPYRSGDKQMCVGL
jgi:hypothetical protein